MGVNGIVPFLSKKWYVIFNLGLLETAQCELTHISSPEVIKELQGGLKALSGKTVILLVYLNLF